MLASSWGCGGRETEPRLRVEGPQAEGPRERVSGGSAHRPPGMPGTPRAHSPLRRALVLPILETGQKERRKHCKPSISPQKTAFFFPSEKRFQKLMLKERYKMDVRQFK